MNKIITITRQFGSGGREIGKKLAEAYGIPFYDNEIISRVQKTPVLQRRLLSAQKIKQATVCFIPLRWE